MDKKYLKSILVVVISTLLAFIFRFMLSGYLHDETPFIFFFLSVIISAWHGGFIPGIAATVLASLLSNYYFLSPQHSWKVTDENGQLLQLGTFILCGILISFAGASLLNEKKRIASYLQKIEKSKAEALKHAQDLSVLTESLPTMVVVIDSNMNIQLANKFFRDWFHEDAKVLGKPFLEVFQTSITLELRHSLEESFKGQQKVFDTEVIDCKQRKKHLHVNIVPVRNEHELAERLIIVGSDITDRIMAAKDMEKSEQEFRTIFELAGSGKFELDLYQYRFLRVNQKFCAITGYQQDELLKMSIFDLLPLEYREERMLKFRSLLINTNREWTLEWQFLRKNGNLFWAYITGAIIYSEGRPSRSISTVQDTTGRKEIELELELEKQRAEEASLAKSAFLANMSHEIRTPLGAMLGFTQVLLDTDTLSEESKKQLLIVLRNGQHLYRLVNELLDISKIEANKMELENITFDLEEVIRDITSLFSMKAKEKGLHFRVFSLDSLPQKIDSDPTRIRQILANLIGNAIKFTETGSVKVELSTESNSSNEDFERLIIRVIDTGPGVPEEKRSLLFQPFSQAETSTTRKHGGTGLGLYLSKRMAEALGGKLTFDCVPEGSGCIFSLTLNVERGKPSERFTIDESEGTETIQSPYAKKIYDRIDGAKVLVVDDVDDNLHLARLYLSASGATVDCALSAPEAFEKIESESYDVIFMDIQMPVIDGYEAIQILRTRGVQLPVVALTAHSMKGEKERCQQAGFTGYLSKPVDRALMIGTVKKYLKTITRLP